MNVAIALTAAIAGWVRCIDEKPQRDRLIHNVPCVGAPLSRLRTIGWILLGAIVCLTAINIYVSEMQQSETEEKLSRLSDATIRVEKATSTTEIQVASSLSELRDLQVDLGAIGRYGSSEPRRGSQQRDADVGINHAVGYPSARTCGRST